MPAAQIESLYYPFAPKYSSRPRRNGAAGCTSCGIRRVYPSNCADGKCGTASCIGSAPNGFDGKGYYNPSGIPRDSLEYGTLSGTCDPKRGCLDPRAQNYDKMALTHCQAMCRYPQPPVCIAEPLTPAVAQVPQCALHADGMTAEKAIYSKQNRRQLTQRALFHEFA